MTLPQSWEHDMAFCGNLENVDRFIKDEQKKKLETSTKNFFGPILVRDQQDSWDQSWSGTTGFYHCKKHSIKAYFGAPGIGKSMSAYLAYLSRF